MSDTLYDDALADVFPPPDAELAYTDATQALVAWPTAGGRAFLAADDPRLEGRSVAPAALPLA